MKDMNGSSYKQWWQDETWALVLTVLCPIIATLFTVLGYFKDFKLLSPNWGLEEFTNLLYAFQTLFMGIVFFYIWGHKDKIVRRLLQKEDLIETYFKRECHITDEEDFPIEERFAAIRHSVARFYQGWMALWLVWLFYNGVMLVMGLTGGKIGSASYAYNMFVFRCIMEMVGSIILFYIYLVLNNVTISKEYRPDYSSTDFRLGAIFLSLCIIAILALFIRAASIPTMREAFAPMLQVGLALGLFSTFTFVLVLGKLNSYYLQIPILLSIFVYIFAIAQVFAPLELIASGWDSVKDGFVVATLPCEVTGKDTNYRIFDVVVSSPVLDVTASHRLERLNFYFLLFSMFGKLALALVLYWTVYKFRFIYFVITKNLALTETPEKMKVFWKYIGKTVD